MAWNKDGESVEYLFAEKVLQKKGAGKGISYTVPGSVILPLEYEQQQTFFRRLAADFQNKKPFSWYEMLENPTNAEVEGGECYNGMAIDIDVKHAPDTPETLQDLIKVTKVFWYVLRTLLPPGAVGSVVGCVAWPPMVYSLDAATRKVVAKPQQLTIFGQPCYIKDLSWDLSQADSDPDLDEHVDVDVDKLAEFDYVDARKWMEDQPKGPTSSKVGLHLYAVGQLDLATGACSKLFISRDDLRLVHVIFAQELNRVLGSRFDQPWETIIDKITSLRIPGAHKIDTPCSNCDTNKRKKAGLPARNSDLYHCPACFGTSKADIGRPYIPIVAIDEKGTVDADRLPRLLCHRFELMLEIARLKYYAEVDPLPQKLQIDKKLLQNPADLALSQLYSTKTKKVRTTMLAPRVTERALKARGPPVELYEAEYGSLYAAFRSWLSCQNYESWRGLSVYKIVIHGAQSNDWAASVFLEPDPNGIYCLREQGLHHRSPIWFKLYGIKLDESHTFIQYCYPCDNPGAHRVHVNKKQKVGKPILESADEAETKPKKHEPLPGGICYDTDGKVLSAFQTARQHLRATCPALFGKKATPQDDEAQQQKVQVAEEGGKSLAFTPARRVKKPAPSQDGPVAQAASAKKRKRPTDMKKMWG